MKTEIAITVVTGISVVGLIVAIGLLLWVEEFSFLGGL
jgi:hypothetical protein